MTPPRPRTPASSSASRAGTLSSLQFLAGFFGAAGLTVLIPLLLSVGAAVAEGQMGGSTDAVFVLAGGSVLLFGLVQLLWNLPLALLLWMAGQRSAMLGVLLASGILFLLNAACWGLLLGGAALSG